MSIAVAVVYGANIYYKCFEKEQIITVSNDASADIRLPISKLTAKINPMQAICDISSGKKHATIQIEENIPVEIDHGQSVAVLITRTDRKTISVLLPENGEVYVGRSKKTNSQGKTNDIILNYRFVSGTHFKIACQKGEIIVTDLGSTNGLFLNGVQISSEQQIRDGDVLSIFTVNFYIQNGTLLIENANNHAKISAQLGISQQEITGKQQCVYPHIRAPRLMMGYEKGTLNIEKPPEAGGAPKFNWMSILLTPAISVALMVFLVTALGMSPVMLIMSGVMSVVSAIVAVVNYFKQKRAHFAGIDQIDEKYNEYLNKAEAHLKAAHQKQLASLLNDYPSPSECLSIVKQKTRRLWERRPEDADFISVRLGLGTIPAAYNAKFQQSQVILQESLLETRANDLAERSTQLSSAPIICELMQHKISGIIGDRNDVLALARNMVLELATLHSYDELKIIAIVPEKELGSWSWMRWLPHCMDRTKQVRFIFSSYSEAEKTLDDISETLGRRRVEDGHNGGMIASECVPHYLFFIATNQWIERHAIKKYLLSSDNIGCSSVFLYSSLSLLPKECIQIIEASNGKGEIFNRFDSRARQLFFIDNCNLALLNDLSRTMAPIVTDTDAEAVLLPSSVSFLRGYGISRPEQLQIGKRWEEAKAYKSLSVPIASRGGDSTFDFDIHEKFHGVNGIVAGMPGSGKTEMVQSWLLSMAVHFSPQDVSFVLIDFKGTGMIAPFRNIPHLAGSISNLDTNIDRNLQAIQSEVHRREAIIDKYSSQSIKNVNDLNKAYDQGKVPEKLPILLIVIDEYAEFKKVFPEFGAEVDSLTSKGRALGMFVILMTQKPAGVVSAKSEDNIKFRWCLRVANYSASREMLGKPDAARITYPGRCYIKVGEDDIYEEVQSFWSGAPYLPENSEEQKSFIPISKVALNGERTPCERKEKPKKIQAHGNEIDAVVRYICEYCKENNIPNAEQVWTERLPERFALTEILQKAFDGRQWPDTTYVPPVIGLIDEPANQRQYPMSLDFPKLGNTLVYGAPVTGKTTLLQTLIMSLAMTRKPEEVSIYIMDFGGWNLNAFRNYPHVGGIANDNEPERLKKLIMLLNGLFQQRKEAFLQAGVGNILAYRASANVNLPDVFLLIDNFGALLKMYPETDAFFMTLASGGANYGIYIVATASAANSVPMKITQNFKNTLALQMIDKSDYTFLVGKAKNGLPQIAGRGYAKGNPPLEFQTALPAPCGNDSEIGNTIRKIGEAMNQAWKGERPERIPEMPEQIIYGSVETDGIALGLSTDRIEPVVYRPDMQHFLLISGLEQSGKSTLLVAVARQMKEKFGGRLVIFDIKRSDTAAKRYADTSLTSAHEVDAFIENLRPELQNRQLTKQQDANASFTPIILAIDDYSDFFAAVSNDTIARLLAIVKIGRGLDLYLVVAGSAYEISSMSSKGEAVLLAMSKAKQTVMLGGCMNDHAAIPVDVNYSAKNIKVKEHEGFFIRKSKPTEFRAICLVEG